MAETFHLSVLTPERPVIDEDVVSIIAPGSLGYLGVLAHHAPLITSLSPGKLSVRESADTVRVYAVSGGFLEVSDNKATILADTVEAAEDIDVPRAERARDAAREQLKAAKSEDERAAAQLALDRAQSRIRIAKSR